MAPNIHTSESGLMLADAGKFGQKQKVIKMCDTYPSNMIYVRLNNPSLRFLIFFAEVYTIIVNTPEILDLFQEVHCVTYNWKLIDQQAARDNLQIA